MCQAVVPKLSWGASCVITIPAVLRHTMCVLPLPYTLVLHFLLYYLSMIMSSQHPSLPPSPSLSFFRSLLVFMPQDSVFVLLYLSCPSHDIHCASEDCFRLMCSNTLTPSRWFTQTSFFRTLHHTDCPSCLSDCLEPNAYHFPVCVQSCNTTPKQECETIPRDVAKENHATHVTEQAILACSTPNINTTLCLDVIRNFSQGKYCP